MGELSTALSFNVDNLRRVSGSLYGAEWVGQLSWSLRSRSIEYEVWYLDQVQVGCSERDGTKRVFGCEVARWNSLTVEEMEADVI